MEKAIEKNKEKLDPKTFLAKYGLYVILVVLFVFFSFASPYFLQPQNFINILVSVSVIGIIAPAMTLAIIGWGPDLSVGSTVAFVGCLQGALVTIYGMPWYVGLGVGLIAGLLIGLINGIVIVKFNLAPFIVTLAMMNVVRGLSYVMVDGMSTFVSDPGLLFLGRERLFSGGSTSSGIPLPIIVLLLSFLVFFIISSKTIFGRHVYACGGNRIAARLAGINTKKVGIALFALTGLMAAIAGSVLIGISGAAIPATGESYALDIVTAVILGGTMLSGGKGSVSRTLVGVLVIGILNNGMGLLALQTFWQTTARGVFLLLAIILDSMQHKAKN